MSTHCRLVAGLSSLTPLFVLLEVQDPPPLLALCQLSLANGIVIGLTRLSAAYTVNELASQTRYSLPIPTTLLIPFSVAKLLSSPTFFYRKLVRPNLPPL